MAIFTMIMGNAFAAFAVITAGIGIPFVYSQGANPASSRNFSFDCRILWNSYDTYGS